MEASEVIFHLRSGYYLGNYTRALEFYKEAAALKFPAPGCHEIRSIVIRNYLNLFYNNEKQAKLYDSLILPLEPEYSKYSQYLLPLLNGKSDAKELLKKLLEDKFDKLDPIHKVVIQNLVTSHVGEFNRLLIPSKEYMSAYLEALALSFYGHLACNQRDKAEKDLETLTTNGEDDILVNLSNIQFSISEIRIGKLEQAYANALTNLDELKEKFEESAKLINYRAILLINQNKYDDALLLLNKLIGAMTAKENLYNKEEYEVAISHQAVASYMLRKKAEHEQAIEALLKLDEKNSSILKDYNEAKAKIQQLQWKSMLKSQKKKKKRNTSCQQILIIYSIMRPFFLYSIFTQKKGILIFWLQKLFFLCQLPGSFDS